MTTSPYLGSRILGASSIRNILLVVSAWALTSGTAFADSGKTDSQGGHHDRRTGVYHCHSTSCHANAKRKKANRRQRQKDSTTSEKTIGSQWFADNNFSNPMKPLNAGLTMSTHLYGGDLNFGYTEHGERPARAQTCVGDRWFDDPYPCNITSASFNLGSYAEGVLKIYSWEQRDQINHVTIAIEGGQEKLYGGELTNCKSLEYVADVCDFSYDTYTKVYKGRMDYNTYSEGRIGVSYDTEHEGDLEGEVFVYAFAGNRHFYSNEYGWKLLTNKEYGLGVDWYSSESASIRVQWAINSPNSDYNGRFTMMGRVHF